MEYLQKKLEKLADALLAPFLNFLISWLRGLSWLGRLMIVSSTLFVAGVFINQDYVIHHFRILANIPRVISKKPWIILIKHTVA